MTPSSIKTNKPASSKLKFPWGILLMAAGLAYIVQTDTAIPSWLILAGAVAGLMYLLAKSLKSPATALLALTAYVPFSKILVGDFGNLLTALNFTNLLMIFVFMGLMLSVSVHRRPLFEQNALNLPIFLFATIAFVSFVKGAFYFEGDYDPFQLFIELKRWLTPILIFFLAHNALNSRDDIKNTLTVMMLVVFLVGGMATWDYMNVSESTSLENSRIGGISDQPNQLAAFFVYYIFLFIAFFLTYYRSFPFWSYIIPILIVFRGLQVTFSRGGYLAFAFGMLGLAFFRSKILFVAAVLFLGFAFVNPQLLPEGIRYRLQQTLDPNAAEEYSDSIEESLEASSRTRIRIWKTAAEMIKDEPLFGFGYGTFPYVLAQYNPELGSWDAHNSYLIMAGEMGLPVVAVFLWIVGILLKEAIWIYYRTKDLLFKSTALGVMGCVFGLLMVNLFGSRLNALEISGYFWILCGIITRIKAIEKSNLTGHA